MSALPSPRVSVIVPTYNRAQSLKRALDSVATQTFRDYEIIIVDDASTDGGCRSLGGSYRNLRILRHESNRGAAAARNTGVSAAGGEFVAFLDSDDEWMPHKLATQVAVLDGLGPPWDAVVSAYLLVDATSGRERAVRAPFRSDPRRSLLLGCGLSPGSTLICRRSYFAGGHIFDERLRRLEDWDWLLAYSRERRLALTDEPLATVHRNSTSHSLAVAAALDLLEDRHGRRIAESGWLAYRKFRSTIALERAAAAYRNQDYASCGASLLRSVVLYPLRMGFLATALDQAMMGAAQRIRRRPGANRSARR